VLFGANPVVLFQSVGSGHNDLLVALSVAAAWVLVSRGRTVAAASALALGALVKATAVLPLVLLIVWVMAGARDRLRALVTHLGTAGAIGLAVAAPFLQTRDPTLGMVELAGHEGWLAPSRFIGRTLGGLAGWLGGDGAQSAVTTLVRISFAVALVAVVVLVAAHVARRPATPPAPAWGWSLVALMLLGPVLLPWYVVWSLPLAWLLPRAPRLALVATGVALSVSQFTAEPARFPGAYDANVLFGHYVLAPILFGLLLWIAGDVRRRLRDGDLASEHAKQVTAGARGD
jgi:alpha-1,6-mannosyltransferase